MKVEPEVLVTGASGMVGSAICRALDAAGIAHAGSTHLEADLRDRRAVDKLMSNQPYKWVIIAAARVGGIYANDTYPAQFIYDNLMIEANLIDSAYRHGITKLLFLGSSCIYPRDARQPISESALLTGSLEPTNEPYAIAKIAGIKLCESYNRQYATDFRSLMPANLYGPGDNFHPDNSHVIPALMRRFHQAHLEGAEEVTVWGSGEPRREFLHVDDLASAAIHIMNLPAEEFWQNVNSRCSHLNVGIGSDISIRELAETLKEVVGLRARIRFDRSKPDGVARKLLDVQKLSELGWSASIGLRDGLADAYEWFRKSADQLRV